MTCLGASQGRCHETVGWSLVARWVLDQQIPGGAISPEWLNSQAATPYNCVKMAI